jgi:hypothetical protein
MNEQINPAAVVLKFGRWPERPRQLQNGHRFADIATHSKPYLSPL